MKIALIEAAAHHEVVNAYIKMFAPWVEKISIYSIHQNEPYFTVKSSNASFLFPDSGLTLDDLIDQHLHDIASCDIIIFTSEESVDGSLLHRSVFSNAFLLVHTFNCTTRPYAFSNLWIKPQRIFEILLKRVKNTFTRSYEGRIILYRKFSNILVASTLIADYIKTQKLAHDKEIFVAPFYGIEKRERNNFNNEHIKIAVPGTVNGKTRCYEDIEYVLRNVTRKCTVFLVGAIHDTDILDRLKKNCNQNTNLVYSISGYSKVEYDQIMDQAHIAILPLSKYMKMGISYEIQGLTCLSGTINDVLGVNLPFMYPRYIRLPNDLEKVSTCYKTNQDLVDKINKLGSDDTYESMRQAYLELYDKISYPIQGKMTLDQLYRHLSSTRSLP